MLTVTAESQVIEKSVTPMTEAVDVSASPTDCVTDLPALEESRQSGLLRDWESLVAADPMATFYQGPAWCMEWYRAYRDSFGPLVLFVTRGERLAGLIPLAVEKSTNRLAFAGDNMSDYRDVIALPGYRDVLVSELLRLCRSENFPGPWLVGPTQPDSDTVKMILAKSGVGSGVRSIGRSHPCWRLWFEDSGDTKKLTSKESIRRHLSYYKRQGAVSLERIEGSQEWDNIKEDFYVHHSLRQLQAGRPVSFNDERKRLLHDALIENNLGSVHVTALRVGERYIAYHFGTVEKAVLYWGAPAFDIREEKHSPGQILLALLLQDAEASGIRGIDFTLGTEEFKKRFGNDCVHLPSVEIYSNFRRYQTQKIRDRIVANVKISITRRAGQQKWDEITQLKQRLKDKAQKAKQLGLKDSLSRSAKRALSIVRQKNRGLIFVINPSEVREIAPTLAAGELCSFRKNEVGDLQKWDGDSRETIDEIQTTAKRASDCLQGKRTLHTIVINDHLAVWGWSYWPDKPALITETHTQLEFDPNSVSLYGFYTIPAFRRRRLYQALLTQILKERFAEGAERAYIMCEAKNVASGRAIEGAGFRLVEIHESSRFLWHKRQDREQVTVTSKLAKRKTSV